MHVVQSTLSEVWNQATLSQRLAHSGEQCNAQKWPPDAALFPRGCWSHTSGVCIHTWLRSYSKTVTNWVQGGQKSREGVWLACTRFEPWHGIYQVWWHICNLSTQELEARGLEVQGNIFFWQYSKLESSLSSKRSSSSQKRKSWRSHVQTTVGHRHPTQLAYSLYLEAVFYVISNLFPLAPMCESVFWVDHVSNPPGGRALQSGPRAPSIP